MSHHSSPAGLRALRRALTNFTAASRGVGASRPIAKSAYSRLIDMQARLNTSLTDSLGVGMGCFVIDLFRLLVAVPAASRAVSAADSPVTGGAVLRAQHQA